MLNPYQILNLMFPRFVQSKENERREREVDKTHKSYVDLDLERFHLFDEV